NALAAAAVAVGQAAGDHVADDLHVGVAVRREAAARRNPVLVDHPQRPPAHPLRIVVVAEGKAVAAVEPAGADVAALGAGAEHLHRAYAPSPAAAGASVVMCSSISSATFGTYRPRPKSLRLMVAVASKPAVGVPLIGWSPTWLMVASSTTSLVMSLIVSSPASFSLPSPAASTEVLRNVASGNLAASKKSSLSRWSLNACTFDSRPDSGSVTSTLEADTSSAS